MSAASQPDLPKPPAADECPLPAAAQTRNLVLYALTVGAVYLGAPVLYVGVVQANLLNELGTGDFLANLPSTAYLLTAPVALFIAWYFPQVRALQPVLIVA